MIKFWPKIEKNIACKRRFRNTVVAKTTFPRKIKFSQNVQKSPLTLIALKTRGYGHRSEGSSGVYNSIAGNCSATSGSDFGGVTNLAITLSLWERFINSGPQLIVISW